MLDSHQPERETIRRLTTRPMEVALILWMESIHKKEVTKSPFYFLLSLFLPFFPFLTYSIKVYGKRYNGYNT